MNILFSSPHQTAYNNLKPVLEKKNNVYFFKYICQCNFYTESLKLCEQIKKEFPKIDVFCLANYFKFNSYYRPTLLHRIYIKIYIFVLMFKLKNLFDTYIFCPGGLVEGTVSKIMSKKGKKTIMIEGGFPLDNFLNLGKKMKYQKILMKIFPNHNLNRPLKYIDYFLVSGSFSKTVRENHNFESIKLLSFGVPRYINLFNQPVKKIHDRKFDIIFLTGAFDFHGMDDLSLTQIQIIKELSEFSVKNNLKTAIQVHPRLKNNFDKFKNLTYEINNFESNLLDSKLSLSLYSSGNYESILLGTVAFFIGKNFTSQWPEKELRAKSFEDLLEIINLSDSEYKNILKIQKQYSKLHINDKTVHSVDKLCAIIEND